MRLFEAKEKKDCIDELRKSIIDGLEDKLNSARDQSTVWSAYRSVDCPSPRSVTSPPAESADSKVTEKLQILQPISPSRYLHNTGHF